MSDEAHEETERLLQDLEQRITEEYRQAAAEMQQKLLQYQSDFKRKNIKKLEELRDGKITPDEYSQWYKGQVLIGQRWIDMRDTLAADMTHANEITASIISGQTPEIYAINHNYATFQIEKQSRINTAYTLYSRETVARLIRENPELLPTPRVDIPKDLRYNKQIISSAALQGIMQGENAAQIAKRLAPEMAAKATMEHFGVKTAEELERKLKIAAVRNARTIVTSAQNSGRIDAHRRANDLGIKTLKVWLATPDSRVRDSHARLDGEERETGKEFSNGCMYPGDPNGDPAEVYNCRCTLITQVSGAKRIDLSARRLDGLKRDYVNGENMTYQDWKDYHSNDPKKRNAAREKWEESETGERRKQRYYD